MQVCLPLLTPGDYIMMLFVAVQKWKHCNQCWSCNVNDRNKSLAMFSVFVVLVSVLVYRKSFNHRGRVRRRSSKAPVTVRDATNHGSGSQNSLITVTTSGFLVWKRDTSIGYIKVDLWVCVQRKSQWVSSPDNSLRYIGCCHYCS